MFQVPEGVTNGEGLQIKGDQGLLQVQHEKPSFKGLQEQEGAVQWHQQGSRRLRLLQLRKLRRDFTGRQSGATGGLGLQRIHANGQGSLQGP